MKLFSGHPKAWGFFEIILSGFFFGFLGVFGKSAFERGIEPGELLGLRFLISGLLFLGLLLIFKPRTLRLSCGTLLSSFLLGVFGYALFSSLYFMALQGVSASLTVLLLYTYPTLVTLGDRIFFKERIGMWGIAALGVSFVGLVCLVAESFQVSSSVYLLFGIGSAFFYAVYILLSRKLLVGVNPLGSSCYLQIGAGITLCLISFSGFERPLNLVWSDPGIFMGMAIVCSLIPLTLFLSGLQKVTPTEASILSTTEPIFGVLIAALALGERVTLLQTLGGALVLGGMILISLRTKLSK